MTCYEYLETIFLLHRMSLLVVVIDLGDFVSSQEACDYFFFKFYFHKPAWRESVIDAFCLFVVVGIITSRFVPQE